MTDTPTEGAVSFANELVSKYWPDVPGPRLLALDIARDADREAVAPAVRDLLAVIEGLTSVEGIAYPLAIGGRINHLKAKYRHLTDQATDQEVV